MIAFLSRIIADFLCRKNVISDEYKEICAYGYEVLFFNLFNAFLILFLGVLLDKLAYSITFFLIFAVLRQYCGGFHAKSTFACTIAYITSYLFVIITSGSKNIDEIYTLSFYIVFHLAFLTMIVLYAPIDNSNKPIDKSERPKYKKKSVIISFFIMIVGIIAYYINIHLSAVISLTLFVIMIMMFAGMYGGKEENNDEKDAEFHG